MTRTPEIRPAAAPDADAPPDWDAVAELWQEARPQRLWRKHSDAVNRALAERWLPHEIEALLKTDLWDEAMGAGLYPVLAVRAGRVVGIDVSDRVAASAHERYPALEAHQADARRLPFADGKFDAIVSNSTLDHFESQAEIDASIGEFARVLRPDGTLVLTLDNPVNPVVALGKLLPRRRLNSFWLRHGELSARIGMLPYYVGATYGRRAVRNVLERNGFVVHEIEQIVHAPRIAAVVVAHVLERYGSRAAQERFLRILASVERIGRAPTRYFTGHFVAVRATRR